ncbi:MAG: patatin-like phospholipase family protein [Clostridia bacterium]|nr:patatin-like phospholipase family protein [Clostridia bacterium]
MGIALGSGGAKGFAELGAIRAFEENGVYFDVFAGSSIGSIIGAFLSNGYSSTDIMNLIKSVDFSEILSKLMIKMDTDGLYKVLDKMIGGLNIEELQKPYRAVATEMESGDMHVFSTGSVAQATCASSCYPPFFKPVVIGGRKYVDGAFSNSIPADQVRDMGAEYVVGIDLSSTVKKKPTFLTKMFTTYVGKEEKPSKKGYDNADVMLHPDLNDFNPTSFSAGNIMYEIGYNEAIKMIPKIKEDVKRLSLTKPKKQKKK